MFVTRPYSGSIWGCIEMDAAARDFKYRDYLIFHEESGCTGKELSEANYHRIVDILNSDMEEHERTRGR